MMNGKAIEVFTPGEFVKDELEARGWTQDDLAEILGRPTRLVNEIISGKRGITPDTAKGLSEAFGTTAQLWMNLEASYRLSLTSPDDSTVARRALLYEKAPVRLMMKRNWIEPSSDIEVLEKRVCGFFGLNDINDTPQFVHAARKSTTSIAPTPLQQAWLYRAVHLSKSVNVKQFSLKKLDIALEQVKALLPDPQKINLIPQILSEAGIKFLIIEPLPKSKIDGVTFWTDAETPVIALSLRYDRIDYFWHTLAHELTGHVKNGDAKNDKPVLDIDILSENEGPRPDSENTADKNAVSFLVPQKELTAFIDRVSPLYSKKYITEFAGNVKTHPGIVVGQLQYRKELTYSQYRETLVKVRSIITGTALTDGWGYSLPTGFS